jgi:hypothetical protein
VKLRETLNVVPKFLKSWKDVMMRTDNNVLIVSLLMTNKESAPARRATSE